MIVKVNNTTVTVFDGAKVKDVIRAYYATEGLGNLKKIPVVRDAYGHKVGLNGAVLENSKLYIEKNKKLTILQKIIKILGI